MEELTNEDNLSVERIEKSLNRTIDDPDEMWGDFLPSFQRICVRYLISEVKRLHTSLDNLVGVIEAHELESLDCDDRGDYFCNCLSDAVKQAKTVLAEVQGENA